VLVGPIAYLTLLFDPLTAAAGLVIASVVVHHVVSRPTSAKAHLSKTVHLVTMCAIPVAGFLATYLAFRFAVGFDLLSALRHVMRDATHYNATARPRYYSSWLVPNLREVVAALGMVIAALVLFEVVQIIGKSGARGQAATHGGAITVFTLSTVGTLILLLLLGVSRTEVLRLWIFLYALVVIIAAYTLSERLPALFFYVALTASIAHITLLLHMTAFPVATYFFLNGIRRIAASSDAAEISLGVFVGGLLLFQQLRRHRSMPTPAPGMLN
jgi:hypothetical protein